jgi:hypothetical protein
MAGSQPVEHHAQATSVAPSDRAGLYMTAVGAGIGILMAILTTAERIVQLAKGADIPVLVPLTGENAELPLGPQGTPVPVAIETGTVLVNDPAVATEFAMWAQPIVMGLAVVAGLIVAALFVLRLARGQAFQRGTERYAFAAALIVTVAYFLNTILTNMVTNGSLAAVSGGDYESVTFTVSLAPVAAVFLIASVGVALKIGERLQRETEGLV